MLYVALLFHTQSQSEYPHFHDPRLPAHVIWTPEVGYAELCENTGLSRKLVAGGLRRLENAGLILRDGNAQCRRYALLYRDGGKWSKIPCQPLVRNNRISAFHAFTMRSKYELHALKLYLYLLSIRPNERAYAQASYEKIHAATGIPERDIQRAIAHLVNVRLIEPVTRIDDEQYGANAYRFFGGQWFFTKSELRSDGETAGLAPTLSVAQKEGSNV